jgi:hypothetical protein
MSDSSLGAAALPANQTTTITAVCLIVQAANTAAHGPS